MKISPFLILFIVVSAPLVVVGLVLSLNNYELVAWRPPLAWTQQYGTTGDFGNSVNAVAADTTGVYTVGGLGYNSTGNGIMSLRKYGSSGTLIWEDTQEGPRYSQFSGVSLGNDNIYVVATGGVGQDNISVLKLNFDGSQLWARQIATGDYGTPVISANPTGVYVAGTSRPLTNQTYTGSVLFVREYDTYGNIVWTSEFSNSSGDWVEGIYADSSAAYVLTTRTLLKYDLGGDNLWTLTHGGDAISGDESSVYVTNSSLISRGGVYAPSGFLTKYSSNGSVDWSVQFDPPDHSGYYRSVVSADSSGAYWAVTSVGGNVYMTKHDSHGNQEWSFRNFHNFASGNDGPTGIASGSIGFYLGGTIIAGLGKLAFLEAYSGDGSLIFFGLNPPLSFIAVGAISVVLGTGIVWYARRRKRNMRLGLGRAERRLPSYVPGDIAST